MSDQKTNDSINFVARHYSSDSFSPRHAWRNISSVHRPAFFTRSIVAASVAVLLAASAAAAIFYLRQPATITSGDTDRTNAVRIADPVSLRFDFNDTPLSDVVRQIEAGYNIHIVNLPDDNPKITLSFEGTAPQLIDLINESTDSKLAIGK